jgi:hypothetical protein
MEICEVPVRQPGLRASRTRRPRLRVPLGAADADNGSAVVPVGSRPVGREPSDGGGGGTAHSAAFAAGWTMPSSVLLR